MKYYLKFCDSIFSVFCRFNHCIIIWLVMLMLQLKNIGKSYLSLCIKYNRNASYYIGKYLEDTSDI